ncbi:hypothetical protein BG95_08535 [Thermosipho sp. 1063]|uniref:S41 family peptidase n=1 Tax=unclassified Thermosipho (in: thermotogales) TaxID=2676525 RepID=UPI0009507F35|nr:MULTISPECIES: S41 family peptidase [unclassified Thermosipho (in: thermotogales)]APT73066.1 hypothetical protein BG95_08535 [Thermosipho sp. 1063]OOC42324.1 hypothetical protein XO08_08615 [Thermosipho sp. 1074]
MKNIQKWISILLLLFAMISFNQQLFSPEELQKDFEIYINYILKSGIDPFEFVSQEKFYSEVNRIKGQLNKPMTKGEFFKTIAPIIHIFSDGHYGVFFNITPDILVMPFEPVVVGNRLFVKNSLVTELENKVEILKIDDRNVEEIINDLKLFLPKISSDVLFKHLEDLIKLFPEIEDKNNFKVLIKTNDIKKVIKVNAIKFEEAIKKKKELYPEEWKKRKLSFERRRDIGILKISTFMYSYRWLTYYKEFLNKTFSENEDLSDLIIDLRGNSGGFLDNVWELFKYLTQNPLQIYLVGYTCKNIPLSNGKIKRTLEKYELNPKILPARHNFNGKIWLLVNNRMFSAAVVATYFFKKLNVGKIIGKRPREPVNSLGAALGKYILPNTKILVLIPGGYYKITDNPKIEVDYEKELTEDEEIDYLLGENDVMLDYAFEIINKNTKGGGEK